MEKNRFIRLFDLSSHILIAVYWFAIYVSFKCSYHDRYRTLDGYFNWSAFFKEKASLTIWLLGIIAFIGVFLLVGLSDNEEISLIGCLLVLASTIVVALWLRLSKSVLGNLNPKVYTALSLQLGTLIGLPFMLLLVKDWNINFSYSSIIALLYLGIGCSLFANWAWNKGLSETETNKSGIFLALEPVFGVLFSIILLNDSLSITSWVGVALVILSAAVCLVLPKKN